MTDFLSQSGIGNRIQAIRKQHGIRSAKDLAAQVPGNSVTEAIVQNIEAGRKLDLSVSQLLNIANALRVSPIFLLTPIATPLAKLDIANLSPDFAGMTVVEFDAWISGEAEGAYAWATHAERSERTQLEAMRDLHAQIRERRQLTTKLEADHALTATAGNQAAAHVRGVFDDRLHDVSERIRRLASYLDSAGWALEDTTE